MAKLTAAQIAFLSLLDDRPRTRLGLPPADREQQLVRQSCRRKGYAECVGAWDWKNKVRRTSGWIITPAGRAALAEHSDG